MRQREVERLLGQAEAAVAIEAIDTEPITSKISVDGARSADVVDANVHGTVGEASDFPIPKTTTDGTVEHRKLLKHGAIVDLCTITADGYLIQLCNVRLHWVPWESSTCLCVEGQTGKRPVGEVMA